MSQRLAVAVSMALLVLTGWLLWARMSAPSDGSVVQLSNRPWHQDRIPVHFVLDPASELRPHDEVVGIDGHLLTSLPDRVKIAERSLREGERFVYIVDRDGAEHEVTVWMGDFPIGAFLASNWSSVLVLGSLLAVAVFVFAHRPADPAAHAVLVGASFAICGTTGWLLGSPVVRLAAVGPNFSDVAGELALALVWGSAVHFTLVAPGAGLVVTRPRLVAAYALPIVLHGAFLAVTLPGAAGAIEVMGRVAQVSLLPSLVLPVVTAVLMVVSYRSTRDELSRRRLRWLPYSLILTAAALLCIWTVPSMAGDGPILRENLMPLVLLPFPLALGAAVLRYRLFDIEVILRRSLVYGSLTACVIGLYLAATWLLSSLIGQRSVLVALLGTCLVALSAQPLRTYLHRRVGRLIYGERDDPYEVVSRLGQVDAAAAPQTALTALVEVLAQTLRLPYVAIELRTPANGRAPVASCGSAQGTPAVLPLTRGDEMVGRLLLDVGSGREPFGPADQRLLDTLIREVSGAASIVLLTAELQQSREQLVLAREEERRRLHHRLHDGLGPNLAAGVMQMEVAKKLLLRDPDRAENVLEELITRTREVIGEVRGLVYNLRPPALDQLGLAGAIRERAVYLAQPASLHVVVEERGDLAELPAAVEVAAFWIAVEAVNNAVRHAGATHCRVHLTRPADLILEVSDDGRGLPDQVVAGGGLVSMRERAQELGGTSRVERNSEGGTTVRARLPIRRQEDAP